MKNGSLFVITAVTIVLVLLDVHSAQAGLFGPSNFDECVLDKMKGQSPNMLATARSACYEKFPQEFRLNEGTHYKKGQLKHSWCATTDSSITICIDENKTKYKFTKVIIKPSKEPCENRAVDEEIEVESSMFSSKYVANVSNAREMKCVFTEFWSK